MNQYNRTAYDARTLDTSRDEGLRSFMLGVYNKMGLGLLLSAALAYIVGTVAPVTQLVFGTPLLYVVQFGPIALLFGSMFFMRNPSPMGAAVLYWAVVSLIGAGLGVWVMLATSGMQAETLTGSMSFSRATTNAVLRSPTSASWRPSSEPMAYSVSRSPAWACTSSGRSATATCRM